jgi:predicted NBD/HSP70 family sugar kinase
MNAERVLGAVRDAGPVTQAEISRRTGLSPASVTNIVRDLAASGNLQVDDAFRDGRRCRVVTLPLRRGYAAGVDMGRTHIRICIVDLLRDVLAEGERSMGLGTSAADAIEIARDLFDEVVAEARIDRGEVVAAGVGLPGPIHHASGTIGGYTLLPQWVDIDLPGAFREAFGLPTYVENDANLGALAEYSWQSGQGVSTLVYVRLATGIGGGMVINGQLYVGASGTAGEIGHVTIEEKGPLCRCGNRGCLETLVSVPAILSQLSGSLGRSMDVAGWVRTAKAGHPASVRLMEDMGHTIGAAVANLCNLVNPQVVALGGPVTVAGPLLFSPIEAEVRRRAVQAASQASQIVEAHHGERSVVVGATLLALAAPTSSG